MKFVTYRLFANHMLFMEVFLPFAKKKEELLHFMVNLFYQLKQHFMFETDMLFLLAQKRNFLYIRTRSSDDK